MTKIDAITIWAEEGNTLVRKGDDLLLIRYTSEMTYSIVKTCFRVSFYFRMLLELRIICSSPQNGKRLALMTLFYSSTEK